MVAPLEKRLEWACRQMPRLGRALDELPELAGVRLAFSIHLDLKMIPLIEGLLSRRAQVYLTTCNPATVRDEVVVYLQQAGAQAQAWRDMPEEASRRASAGAIAWRPTHLCEFGADLTAAWLASSEPPPVRASLEGTGSGIARLQGMVPPYPIYNWDDHLAHLLLPHRADPARSARAGHRIRAGWTGDRRQRPGLRWHGCRGRARSGPRPAGTV
jgi:adenosylhomocysteinase